MLGVSQAIEGEVIITFCGTNACKLFKLAGLSKTSRRPAPDEQTLLDQVQVRLLEPAQLPRFNELLEAHHYLQSPQPFGERLYYVVTDAQGQWLALLLFSAAAQHLKLRERWIGWTSAQARRRLSLVVNHSRFLVLPDKTVPNLGSKALRLVLDRLSADWQARYGHPVLVVETFVDPDQFCGTVYTANGWQELGQTDGWGRHRQIITSNTISPNDCSSGSFVATPAAVSKPSISNRIWPRSKPRCQRAAPCGSKKFSR